MATGRGAFSSGGSGCRLFLQKTKTSFENSAVPPPDPNLTEWLVLACVKHSKSEARIVESGKPPGCTAFEPTEIAPLPDAHDGSTMTVVGALTTTFRAPSSCTTDSPRLYQVWSEKESHYVEGPLFTQDSGCFPSGYDPAPTNYHSPGWCPYGYTTGCSSLASTGTVTETAVICCPTNFDYTCQASPSSGQSLIECTTAWSAAEVVLQGVTVVTDGEVGTTTVVTEPSNTITAYGIQVRFKSTDPTPVPVIDDPGFLVISRTPGPPISIPTELPAPTRPLPPSSNGVSTPAAIGIGVGSAIAALLIAGAIGLFFFLRWRRKKRPSSRRSSIPPPVPPKELSASPLPYRTVPPPFELSNEAASPRPPSTSTSKRHLSMSPGFETAPTLGVSRDSVVPAGYLAVELEAPSEASLRDRASPESESSGWTDRQARGGTMPMPWI
ncbi:hypothetical protein CHGG_10278 [Chaetomium globosum CBS 148.51]|uniref:Uncharacterized protein n=1 Tax=Chaetomium globosum (strain ATCC 6205 / CBS 148.51 / DSM 1962 / NBRC 6347 / NRRL 1970) TaxID=306901 RepID=Q2GP26_CHAGB|nr:uncharacterized protein CHGG_10278 [Chaetomium globosum CBS 148.51]EAQ83874.1 hypothetical protein CHGG_10278 [Chaetomium globosum CBS 148.51]